MTSTISNSLSAILICPKCVSALNVSHQGAKCGQCNLLYKFRESGSLDLRLQQEKRTQYEFSLGTPLIPEAGFEFSVLPMNNSPAVEFSNVDVPRHLTRELMSYIPKASSADSLMLDLGCGSTVHQAVCEHAGYEYVGLDYTSDASPILGDAHALPFKDNSFEFILSIAVLEHIQFPFVMTREAYRVLKPGGMFIGTVAFLEPFHESSFYHHTHLGTYNSLSESGFEIECVAPSNRWSVLIAQAHMGLFPRMPRFLAFSLVMPILYASKLWWKIWRLVNKTASEEMRVLVTTGAFTFIARRKA